MSKKENHVVAYLLFQRSTYLFHMFKKRQKCLKGAVYVVDEMKSLYSISHVGRIWHLTIFYSMLNIGAVNPYIIYKANNENGVVISQ